MLTASKSPSTLLSLTADECRNLRDAEWEKRESGYHDIAISELNAIVKRYNGVAPFPVRKTYFNRAAELQKVYEDGAEEILKGVRRRVADGSVGGGPYTTSVGYDEEGEGGQSKGESTVILGEPSGLWDIVKSWIRRRRA